MNGPYPPVAPPKPPDIEVSHTVDVTSTAKSPRPSKEQQQRRSQPEKSSNQPSKPRDRKNTRTSVFAESLDQAPTPPPSRIKREPRIEPPGSAFRGRPGGQVNPEIGLISFLCEYPRARARSMEPKKNLFQDLLHRSSSERRLLSSGPGKKLAQVVATRKTSDGRGYGQIVIAPQGLYGGGNNKSTYKVNDVHSFGEPKKRGSRVKRLGEDMVKTVKIRQPIESVSGDGESTVTSHQMADSIDKNMNRRKSEEEAAEQERERAKQARERSPAPILPLGKAAESTFGVDFSSIIKKHEEAVAATVSPRKPKRASFNMSNMTRSESRPNVRDFAEDGRSRFLPSAFRRRSKSPVKRSPTKESSVKQSPVKESPSKKGNKPKPIDDDLQKSTPEVPDLSVYTRRINSIRDSVAQHAGLAGLVPLVEPASEDQRQSAMSQSQRSSGQSSDARNSSTSNGHSKSPSGISAGSNENDNVSEVSSAIISDAQSISIHKSPGIADYNGSLARKPLRPGPAPTGPLPSLPEGHDVQLPATPRRSESSPRRPSPERSPAKSRQKTPAKYRLTPAEGSPTKRPPSPERMNAATQPEQITRKPAAVVRIQTANLGAFPSPPSPERTKRQQVAIALSEKLPGSMSDGNLDPRAERTKKLKARDLARERSQTANFATEAPPPMPLMPKITDGNDRHKDSIERLIDSYDTEQVPNPWHRPQPSLVSQFSTASTQDNRNSVMSSELSPIIIVADQEPITPPKPLSVKTPSEHINGVHNHSIRPETPNFGPATSPHHVREPGSRPMSFDFMQPPSKSPHRPESMAFIPPPDKSPQRSVANRAPTPFAPSFLRRDSHRSSQRSSFVEPDLEARMAAMEKKNLLLERAFLAVMDASASISSGDERSHGRNSGQSFGTGGDRFSASGNGGGYGQHGRENSEMMGRDDGSDKLYAGLEKLLVRQGSGRLSTLSTCSGPF